MVRWAIHPGARTTAALSLMLALYTAFAAWMPYGGWDAWAIWNVRAKFFLLAPELAFSPTLPHTDYPPLLPLLTAWGWRWFGVMPLVPAILHGLIFMLLLALLVQEPSIQQRGWPIWIVGLTALPYAILQYADLALATTLLSAIMFWQQRRELWIGAALGIGLLLKNEGAWIALAFLTVMTIWERRIPWKVALALLFWCMVLMGYKLLATTPNDILIAPGMLNRFLTPSRYAVLGLLTLGSVLGFGSGSLLVLAMLLWREHLTPRWTLPLAALALILVGYLGIYVITPHDLIWHMTSSFDRLILQLFPALVYTLITQDRSALVNREGAHGPPARP